MTKDDCIASFKYHNFTGVQIHNGRQVKPAFLGKDIGDIGYPELIGFIYLKITI